MVTEFDRRSALRLVGLGAAAWLTAGCSADGPRPTPPEDVPVQPALSPESVGAPIDTAIQVDFSKITQPIDELSFGSTITTYNGDGSGSSITRSDAWTDRLRQLGLSSYRLPLRFDVGSGKLFSAAAYAQAEPGDGYVTAIVQDLEARVIPVIGGQQSDNDFTPDEVRGVVEAVGEIQGYLPSALILGNEPTGRGQLDLYTGRLASWIAAAKAVNPDIEVSVASMPDMKQGEADLRSIMVAADGQANRIGVHAYQGESAGLAGTGDYYTIPRQLAQDYGMPVDVEEFNWAPRAGSEAFFGPENTVFTASAIGHVLMSGGRAHNYGDSNGALGLMNDGSGKDSQPGGMAQPLASYHGLGMLTGYNGTFRGVRSGLVESVSTLDGIEVVAAQNGKVVLINKTDKAVSASIGVSGVASDGRFTVWQTDRLNPLEMPQQVISGGAYNNGTMTVDLPPTTVLSLEL